MTVQNLYPFDQNVLIRMEALLSVPRSRVVVDQVLFEKMFHGVTDQATVLKRLDAQTVRRGRHGKPEGRGTGTNEGHRYETTAVSRQARARLLVPHA